MTRHEVSKDVGMQQSSHASLGTALFVHTAQLTLVSSNVWVLRV